MEATAGTAAHALHVMKDASFDHASRILPRLEHRGTLRQFDCSPWALLQRSAPLAKLIGLYHSGKAGKASLFNNAVLDKREHLATAFILDETIALMVTVEAGEKLLLPGITNWWPRGNPVILCTDSGFVGLGSAHTAPGDEIALIDKTFIPAILTPKHNGYVFRGYAYVPLLPCIDRKELIPRIYLIL